MFGERRDRGAVRRKECYDGIAIQAELQFLEQGKKDQITEACADLTSDFVSVDGEARPASSRFER